MVVPIIPPFNLRVWPLESQMNPGEGESAATVQSSSPVVLDVPSLPEQTTRASDTWYVAIALE